jgi:phosphoribosylaminoimidazole carboxylase (NCAIR synthetase)
MTAGMSDKMTPFKGLKVCIQNQQSVTNYGIFGNVQECHKIIFVNYNNEVSATIIPELNGNYAFYSNTENEPFDVIFVTNNITKNNILYQNVKPLDISKSTLP